MNMYELKNDVSVLISFDYILIIRFNFYYITFPFHLLDLMYQKLKKNITDQ